MTLDELLSRAVETPSGCREWQMARDKDGYGVLGQTRAHRVAYRLAHGEPGKLFVCHSCDNPACCNPDHLWLGTHKQNMEDASRKGRNARTQQTHCVNGHEFTPENTYRRPNGNRDCRSCIRTRVSACKQRKVGA